MTTIVYKDGVLASDSSAVTGCSVAYITKYPKIRISECKHFGYGISGTVLDPNWIKPLEVALLAFFMAHRDGFAPTVEVPKDILDLIEGRDWLIMTKEATYARFLGRDKSQRPSRLLEGEFAAIGTGRESASVACLAGKTAVEAVEWGIKLDFYTYPSKVLTIKHSQLKALPKEIKA